MKKSFSIVPSWLSKRQKVLMLALGIYLVYIYQGVLFEDLHNAADARWSFPEGLLLTTLSGNIVVAAVLLWWTAPPPSRVEQYKFLLLSIPSFVAAGCTYSSMSRLDYPTLSLFKAAKPLAILVVAVVACRDHVYSGRQKIMVLCVSVALILFFYFKEIATTGPQKMEGLSSWTERSVGYAGILTALAFDGVGALIATHITKSAHPPSAFHIQMYLNSWSFCVVLTYAVVVKNLSFVAFLQEHPHVILKLVKLGALSGVGQLFIFATITTFDPLALSVITTTRKVFTIVVSTLWFNHSLSLMQWFAVTLLFVGLLWNDVLELASSYFGGKLEAARDETEELPLAMM